LSGYMYLIDIFFNQIFDIFVMRNILQIECAKRDFSSFDKMLHH